MQQDLKLELARRRSQTSEMLRQFKLKGELTTADLMRIGTGCSSRLKELRRDGHRIVSTYEKPGLWRYTYLGDTDEE